MRFARFALSSATDVNAKNERITKGKKWEGIRK